MPLVTPLEESSKSRVRRRNGQQRQNNRKHVWRSKISKRCQAFYICISEMEASRLFADLDLVSSSGVVLSTENKAALQTSLLLLKSAEKFKTVQFWGKIAGIARDYFIAQGIAHNEVTGKKSFYR